VGKSSAGSHGERPFSPGTSRRSRVFSGRAERHPVEIRGIITLESGSTHPVTLIDLSYDGCRIATPVDLGAEQALSLSVRGGLIEAAVRWSSSGEAGLLFTESRKAATRALPLQLARDGKRLPTQISATMRRRGHNKFVVLVGDLSTHGCKVEFADRPEVGDQVRMRFTGLEPVEGHIQWVAGNEAGIRFERPIHPAVLELLIQQLTASK
jgi:hypothetical protein